MTTVIKLTHKNSGEPIVVNVPSIFYWQHSPAQHCTIVVSQGGQFAPVAESVDDITRLVTAANDGSMKEEKPNGIQKDE